jgi:hypothetical protein
VVATALRLAGTRTWRASRSGPRRTGGPTPSWTCAATTSTTSRPRTRAGTARTSTWSSTSPPAPPATPARAHGRRDHAHAGDDQPHPVRLRGAPGRDRRRVDDPGLRADDPTIPPRCSTPWSSVTGTAGGRGATGSRVVRGPPRRALGARRDDGAPEPRAALLPPPPPGPPARVARQAPPRRHPRDHHPHRHHPQQPTTTTVSRRASNGPVETRHVPRERCPGCAFPGRPGLSRPRPP